MDSPLQRPPDNKLQIKIRNFPNFLKAIFWTSSICVNRRRPLFCLWFFSISTSLFAAGSVGNHRSHSYSGQMCECICIFSVYPSQVTNFRLTLIKRIASNVQKNMKLSAIMKSFFKNGEYVTEKNDRTSLVRTRWMELWFLIESASEWSWDKQIWCWLFWTNKFYIIGALPYKLYTLVDCTTAFSCDISCLFNPRRHGNRHR